MLWLFGDSIFRGLAAGVFADELPEDDPRRSWASPAAMLNAAYGEERVAVGGQTLLPDSVDKAAAALRGFRTAPGDCIAMLDAGHHAGDPGRHQAQWLELIAAARAACDRVLVCTAPDNLAEANWKGRYRPLLWHSLPFAGRTHNDAVRAAATEAGVELLDLEPALRAFHLARPDGAYRSDDIHLNRAGQAELCRLLAAAVWPDEPLAARSGPA